jgi:hypothetical protein
LRKFWAKLFYIDNNIQDVLLILPKKKVIFT